MGFNAEGKEEGCGGVIPVAERTAYRTYSDKDGRTNPGVLVANHRVTSLIDKKIFPPHNGFVTANHTVTYILNEVPVLTRRCQIMMRPDKSEATLRTWESFFADSVGHGENMRSVMITKEQFDLLAEMWK